MNHGMLLGSKVTLVLQVHLIDEEQEGVMLAHDTRQLKHIQAFSFEMDASQHVINVNNQIINDQARARKQSFFRNLVAFHNSFELFLHAALNDR